MPYSGNFADVYQVRCPTARAGRSSASRARRPACASATTRSAGTSARRKLPFTVDFSYLEQGIRVVGKWYPVLKMEWVEGLTLNQFVGRIRRQAGHAGGAVADLGRAWREVPADGEGRPRRLAARQRPAGARRRRQLAGLKLIDYDGMWVPALAGTKSGEVGHPGYQHPQRLREQTYSLEVDRFPLLLIATALRA